MANNSDELEKVAANVIERRRRFAEALRASLKLSPAQWEPLRAVLAITGESRFNIYAYYPALFQEAFPSIPTEILCHLAWCGRAALDYILLYDYLLDSNCPPHPVILLGSYAVQREYLAGLQRLFPSSSAFWDYLTQCETETALALLNERQRRQNPLAPFTLDDVAHQAIGKASMARLGVVGLAVLTDQIESERVYGLIRSIDLYNFARQVTDDLLDWRRDYTARRISYLIASALISLNLTDPITDDSYPEANIVGSALYTQASMNYLNASEISLVEALELAQQYGHCPYWQQTLDEQLNTVRRQRATILEVITKTRFAVPRSTKNVNLANTVEAATTYLLMRQESEGCWKDFATAAGESEDWVTGYVGWALCNSNKLPPESKQRAVAWLQASQFPEGGWGYHRRVVVDADSTAWCLRFLRQSGLAMQELAQALKVLLSHQHTSGGFSTYRQPDEIRSYMQMEETRDLSGWCEPQPCVTAAAVGALLACDQLPDTLALQNAMNYIVAHQQPDGSWHSYWWAGPHYATAYILNIIGRLNLTETTSKTRAIEWFLGSQLIDGGWSHAPGQPSTPFFTALALSGLLATDELTPAIQHAVQQGTTWLIKNQEQDGSWYSSALLLLPEPQEREPWKIDKWPISILGTGIARRDHRRLFTTATVLTALERIIVACPQFKLSL